MQCVGALPEQRRPVSAVHLEQAAFVKHTLNKHRGTVRPSVEYERLEEEDAVETRTSCGRAGDIAPRSASRLEVCSAREDDTSLYDVLSDESMQAARSG